MVFELEVLHDEALKGDLLAERVELLPFRDIFGSNFGLNIVEIGLDPGGLTGDSIRAAAPFGKGEANEVVEGTRAHDKAIGREVQRAFRLVSAAAEDGDIEVDGFRGRGMECGLCGW